MSRDFDGVLVTLTPEARDQLDTLARDLGLAAQQAGEQIGRVFADLAEALRPQADTHRRPRDARGG